MREVPAGNSAVPTSDTAPILDCALSVLTAGAPRAGHLADIPRGAAFLSVRAMPSSPRALRGRTAVIRARLPEDVPPVG
jgi:hypothetical protein